MSRAFRKWHEHASHPRVITYNMQQCLHQLDTLLEMMLAQEAVLGDVSSPLSQRTDYGHLRALHRRYRTGRFLRTEKATD